MIEQNVRPLYQRLCVDAPANWLSGYLSANQMTLLSGVLGLFVLPALYFGWVYIAILCLLLSGYCDTLDGTMARIKKPSPWGSVLDIFTDRLVEFTVVFALWSVSPKDRALWIILMLGSMLLCITSFLVVAIFSDNNSEKSFNYSPGLMERAEAFIFFIVMMLWDKAFNIVAFIFCILVIWTALKRLYEFYACHEQMPH